MKKKQKKFKISKEEKGIFIAIGVIILVAVGILLTWYFTRDNTPTSKETPPIVDYSKWEIPADVLTTVFVGQRIEFITTIIFNNKEETAVVTIQRNMRDEWIDIATTENVFIPEEIGLYRYVYTFKGVEKTKNFNVIERPLISWTMPGLATEVAYGRELTVNRTITAGGLHRLATVHVQTRNSAGIWVDVRTENGKFTPTPGAYRYVYKYDRQTKYHNFTVVDWSVPTQSSVIVRSLVTLPKIELLERLGEQYKKGLEYNNNGVWTTVAIVNPDAPVRLDTPGEYRFVYSLGNVTKWSLPFNVFITAMEVSDYLTAAGADPAIIQETLNYANANMVTANYNQSSNVIEIDVFGPLNPIIGLVIDFGLTAPQITTSTPGIYTTYLTDVESWMETNAPNMALLWVEFNDIFNQEYKVTLQTNTGETIVVTLVFRDFTIDVAPSGSLPNDTVVTQVEETDIERNLTQVDLEYDKNNITIDNIITDAVERNILGIIVTLNDYEGPINIPLSALVIDFTRPEPDKVIVWINLDILGLATTPQAITIALTELNTTFEFTVQIKQP